MGKREEAHFFLSETAEHGLEGCNYLLALDMEMDPQPGYAMASWERGYGDFHLLPGPRDAAEDPVARGHGARPLRRRLGGRVARRRLAAAGPARPRSRGRGRPGSSRCSARSSSSTSSRRPTPRPTRSTTATSPRRCPTSSTTTCSRRPTTRGFIRQIRNGMQGAGIPVESSKGEAWPGQHEINFRFADALTMADNHVIYKNGAKEIAHRNGCSITFMAKPDHTWIGNSCHIHASLWRDGHNAFAADSAVFDAVPRRLDRVCPRARALPRAEHQLLQALRRRELGADDARLGPRQPHLRVPDRRPRRARSASRRGSPAATSTRTSRSRR